MKKCFKCNKEKPINDFYKHPAMPDGHLGKCKECTKKDVKKREKELRKNPEYVEKERKRGREKYYRLNYKNKPVDTIINKRAAQRWREKYPEKYIASCRTTELKPKVKGNHLHHWSYNEEHYKDVIELKRNDHYTAHRYMIYDQERMMYRTLDLVLLDTKEKHIKYIEEMIIKDKYN